MRWRLCSRLPKCASRCIHRTAHNLRHILHRPESCHPPHRPHPSACSRRPPYSPAHTTLRPLRALLDAPAIRGNGGGAVPRPGGSGGGQPPGAACGCPPLAARQPGRPRARPAERLGPAAAAAQSTGAGRLAAGGHGGGKAEESACFSPTCLLVHLRVCLATLSCPFPYLSAAPEPAAAAAWPAAVAAGGGQQRPPAHRCAGQPGRRGAAAD